MGDDGKKKAGNPYMDAGDGGEGEEREDNGEKNTHVTI